jgi:3-oxoacyl-[acyl-carrier-protein] synthase-1
MELAWRGTERLGKMLQMAIVECLGNLQLEPQSLPLLLCVAERDRPGRHDRLAADLVKALQVNNGLIFHPTRSAVIEQGRVGAAIALAHARKLITEDGVAQVLVAGVDSLLERRALRVYEERDRLKTSVNSNGFVPGEAASAILLGQAAGEEDLLCVGLGYGLEQATVEGTVPSRAEGMTVAINDALRDAQCEMADLDFRITDNSGEQYYFKEAALALARTLRQRKEEFDIWHPADCIGEVGAAIGPALLVVALFAARKGYAAGNNILCCTGNDSGRRACAVLRYTGAT